MKRHSSNKVKILKIAASATKQTTKLTMRARSKLASIKFGNARVLLKRTAISADLVRSREVSAEAFARLSGSRGNGMRWTKRKKRLKPTMNTVASHGPTYGDIVPARASDSPSSDSK